MTKLLSYLTVTLLTSLLVSIHTVRTGIGSSQHVLNCECRGWGVAGFTFCGSAPSLLTGALGFWQLFADMTMFADMFRDFHE